MTIEGECALDLVLPHEREAHAVGETHVLIREFLEENQGPFLDRFVCPKDPERFRSVYSATALGGKSVICASGQQRQGLVDHEVARADCGISPVEVFPGASCAGVQRIRGKVSGEEGPRIDEDQSDSRYRS